jgi:hypothetical protein
MRTFAADQTCFFPIIVAGSTRRRPGSFEESLALQTPRLENVRYTGLCGKAYILSSLITLGIGIVRCKMRLQASQSEWRRKTNSAFLLPQKPKSREPGEL